MTLKKHAQNNSIQVIDHNYINNDCKFNLIERDISLENKDED